MLFRKNVDLCLKCWETACGPDLSCEDDHVCQENAGPGQPYGDAANGIDGVLPIIGVILILRIVGFGRMTNCNVPKMSRVGLIAAIESK